MRWTLVLILLMAPMAAAQSTGDVPVAGPILEAAQDMVEVPDQISLPPAINTPDPAPLVNATIEGLHDPLLHKNLCDVLRTDGTPCKIDADEDGRYDAFDNCPATENTNQADLDGDGIGDACDEDRDGDGVDNADDAFPDDADYWSDRDGDGSPDEVDAFPDDPSEWADTDGDGVGDNSDACPHYDDAADIDGDGVADACDPDTQVPTSQRDGTWSIADLDGLQGVHQVETGQAHGASIMTFIDATNHLWFAWDDAGWHIQTIDYLGFFARDAALVPGAQAPTVAYYRWDDELQDGDLLLAQRSASGWDIEALDDGPEDRGERVDAIMVDGTPLAVYASWSDGFVRAVQPGQSPIVIADDMDAVTGDVQLTIIGGLPTAAFMDYWDDRIAVATLNGTWSVQDLEHNTSLGGNLALLGSTAPMLAWDCFDCTDLFVHAANTTTVIEAGLAIGSIDGLMVGDVPVLAIAADDLYVATDHDGFVPHLVDTGVEDHVGLSIQGTNFVLGYGAGHPVSAIRDIASWLGPRACGSADDDGDGIGNNCDTAPEDGPLGDLDGDGVVNADDQCAGHDDASDLDGDGMPDGCDEDLDGDGVPNDDDWAPDDGSETRDRDGDGIGDNRDNCRQPNPDQRDADGDGRGDACDGSDSDGDGASDRKEHRAGTDPKDASSFPPEFDRDGDGVANKHDNCRKHPNPDQADLDGDGRGDACDGERDGDSYGNHREERAGSDPGDADSMPDKDQDGVDDKADNCRNHANPDQADLDGDGRGDACDHDTDGDGFKDAKERKAGSDPRDASSTPDSD